MENISNISIPNNFCVICQEESPILLISCTIFARPNDEVIGLCPHKFCQSCFRKENISSSLACTFNCPCCHSPFYIHLKSLDEAILIGEAATLSNYIFPILFSTSTLIDEKEDEKVHNINMVMIEKFEAALELNPTHFTSLYSSFLASQYGQLFLVRNCREYRPSTDYYISRAYKSALRLLDHPAISESVNESIKCLCYYELSHIFYEHYNHSAALKYSKLGYEYCLRSSDHTDLAIYKAE